MSTLRRAFHDHRTDIFLCRELREFRLHVVEEVGDSPTNHLLLEVAVLQETGENEETVTYCVDTVPGGRGRGTRERITMELSQQSKENLYCTPRLML